jgi:flagellar protein FlbT
MGLKVEMKPGERIIIGESLLTNGDKSTSFIVEGTAPILREKDVLTPELADTPCKKIYLAVQMMYLSNDVPQYQENYFKLVSDLISAAPSFLPIIDEINNRILTGHLYKALREARGLLDHEQEILSHARRS